MKDVEVYLQLIKEFKPIVSEALDSIKVYKEEWNLIQDFFIDANVQTWSKVYKGFLGEGLPEDVALALTINAQQNFKQQLNSFSNKKKEK